MATNNNNDPLFNINSYVSFDAQSLRDLIINRLNQNSVFTDQNYQGSNLSSFLDIISFSFSTLLYYLNKTASESMFSEAQIYENMNRIVKLLNYNPIGKISQSVGFNLNISSNLTPGNYIIPRYSTISVGGTIFSFAKDIYFTYTSNSNILFQNPDSDFFLYQGQYNEYPLYSAMGNENEILYINLGKSTFIDHFNIDVYVKPATTGVWEKWQKSENLFLNNANDKVYEIRYNPNQNYEIKFGNAINGKKLQTGDEVLVYYLDIDILSSTIAAGSLDYSPIIYFNSLNYNDIKNNIISNNLGIILSQQQLQFVNVYNQYPSNPYTPEESVDQIRQNTPKVFTQQSRLVTTNDFNSYIENNYNNLFSNSKVVNNDDYLTGHIKYLYDIGIKSPQLNDSVLYSQIKFSNSCNFNNVYTYIVPLNPYNQQYISASQKELIINDMNGLKTLTSEIVITDPVYMYFDFYVKSPNIAANINDLNLNQLIVYKSANTRRSSTGILNEIINTIGSYFNPINSELGQNISIIELSTLISNLDGVDRVQTYRSDTNTYIDGLSLIAWNSSYANLDAKVYTQSVQLGYFQYPLFNNISNLSSRIKIIESTGIIQVTDY